MKKHSIYHPGQTFPKLPLTFRHAAFSLVCISLIVFTIGCSRESQTSPDETDKTAKAEEELPIPVAPANPEPEKVTASQLQEKLKEKNPTYNGEAFIRKAGGEIRYVSLFQTGVRDISPLKGLPLKYLDLTGLPVEDISVLEGMPLEELYLENTEVKDIGVLEGMPLQVLRMEQTNVSDISPLKGMKLKKLNLYGTKVKNIDAVQTMPLDTLWLTDTQVSDLNALQGKYLESLDIENTPVGDLSVLSSMTSLKRLNIAGSQVTDLTPISELQLERLIFTPARIEKGIDVARNMQSLKAIGPSFDGVMPPQQFWPKYDAGEFSSSNSK